MQLKGSQILIMIHDKSWHHSNEKLIKVEMNVTILFSLTSIAHKFILMIGVFLSEGNVGLKGTLRSYKEIYNLMMMTNSLC